jgi:protein involved in polysaccharide export with SLBB domain
LLCAGTLATACTSDETAKSQAAARERAAAVQEPKPPAEYRLQQGDVLTIKFFYSPELNEQMPIRPDGNISLQLIGEVHAAGRTAEDLRGELMTRCSPVMKNPEVAVIVSTIAAQNVFVGGEVIRPGIVTRTPDMTALQAVIAAGGIRNTAELRNVVILRDQGTRQPLFLMADLRQGLKALADSNDIPLETRDIVYVPSTTIADVDDFVNQYITKVLPFSTTFGLQYNLGTLSTK